MSGEKPTDGEASTVAHAAGTAVSLGPAGDGGLDLSPGGAIGRYKIIGRLGAGAMGVVWSALDPQLDRKVAIKVVHGNLARSPDAANRFRREARAMAKLSHRAVVTVHDAGEVEGRLFLAMELVQGTTLGQMLRTRTEAERTDWPRWLDMMLEAGRGLAAAHGAGVLHRDFKPDNVLVDPTGRVCVADFGLATLGEEQKRSPSASERTSKARLELTNTGALLGTPAYMSPQQLRGEAIDARADQFNFCVATYEALYGKRPFASQGEGLEMIGSLEAAIERGEISAPPDDSNVPDEILAALQRGLAADPNNRWTNMTSLIAALERVAKIGKRTMTNRALSASPQRSSRVAVAAIGGAAVAILIAAIAAAIVISRGGRRVPGTAPVSKKTPKHLFHVSLKTDLAMTPDGKRIALGAGRLEVREGERTWTTALQLKEDVTAIELDDKVLRFGVRAPGPPHRWSYTTDNSVTRDPGPAPGMWFGTTAIGDLYYQVEPKPALIVMANGAEVRRWLATSIVEGISISPDRKRIASIEANRFSGRIIIRDVTSDATLETPELVAPTGLAWQDDRTLVYATGTNDEPRILRVRVDAAIGTPEVLHGQSYGWFGEMAIAAGRLLFVEMTPSSRARLVDGPASRDLDHANVGAALGWIGDGEMLTWSRRSRRIERQSIESQPRPTTIELSAEPASATVAGDIVIAAIRRPRGREVVAHELSTGKRLWGHESATTFAVRCAGDRQLPCFAIRAKTSSVDELVAIDPATGVFGDNVIFAGLIEDVAVNEAGDRLLVATRVNPIRELAVDGTPIAEHDVPNMASFRSVAYVSTGGFLVAGTLIRNTYQVGRIDKGVFTLVSQAENDLLTFVRPSRDGKRVLILSRVYAPTVWELAL